MWERQSPLGTVTKDREFEKKKKREFENLFSTNFSVFPLSFILYYLFVFLSANTPSFRVFFFFELPKRFQGYGFSRSEFWDKVVFFVSRKVINCERLHALFLCFYFSYKEPVFSCIILVFLLIEELLNFSSFIDIVICQCPDFIDSFLLRYDLNKHV